MVNQYSKVLWTEGLFLGQQHFQQWERIIEERERLHRVSYHPLHWGLQAIVIDERSLKVGLLKLTTFQGIFPNGQSINLNAAGVSELFLSLSDVDTASKFVYVCLPRGQSVEGLNAYGSAEPAYARWIAHYSIIQDELDSSREREVLFGNLNLQLMLVSDLQDVNVELKKYDYIPVAKLIYKMDNEWALDPNYIPPVVHLHASKVLLNTLEYLEAISVVKIKMLQQKRNELIDGLAPLSIVSTQILLLLQILHQAMAQLQYLLMHSWVHPLNAYEYLVETISKLSALTKKTDVQKIVVYDHRDLKSVFRTLELSFKILIHEVVPERLAMIDFVKIGDFKYCSDNIPEHILEKHSFFLIVLNVDGEIDWINRFLREVKISSVPHLDVIIASALPGLSLSYVPRPPHQLPIKSGYQYFQLGCLGLKSEHWEKIVKTRSMGIFLSGFFVNVEIKLMAIEE